MSNKRKLPIILGTCAATVLASGGSIFLTDTALSLLERRTQNVREAQTEQDIKETELPITVEQFSKTDDSFVVLAKNDSGQEKTSEAETEGQTEAGDGQTGETEADGRAETGGSSSGETGDTASQTGGTSSQTEGTPSQTGGTSSQTENTVPQTEDTTPQTEVESILPGTMYASSDVYVRGSAGTDGEILGVVGEGNGVMATGKKLGNWIEVSYDGKTGYVGGSYLSTEGGSDSTDADGSSTGTGSGSSGTENGSTGSGSSGAGSSTGTDSGSSGTGSSTGTGSGSSGADGGSSGTGGNSGSAVIPVNGTMYATAGVNVRKGPGSSYDRLGAISRGESIGVTGETDGDWTEVVYDGERGYIYSSYLVEDPDDLSSGGSDGTDNSGAWDDSYIYDVSSYYCDESEFDGWSATDLAYLRNEIFARHGRIFTTEKYRDYFSQKTWYNPTYDPSYFDENLDSFLNDYEWANLKLIQKLEDARY